MRYRVYHKEHLMTEPMGYLVQRKKWWWLSWETIYWFPYEERNNAYNMVADIKEHNGNRQIDTLEEVQEWCYLWDRISKQTNKIYDE